MAADRRIYRIESGNFGDHKSAVKEYGSFRIDLGGGYRIYYGLLGTQVVLLLCAGDKDSQTADLERAVLYWKKAQEESNEPNEKP